MFPDDAKQVKEMMKIQIICKIIRLSHIIILFPPNSNQRMIKQSSSVLYRNILSLARLYSFNSEKVHPYYIHSDQIRENSI